MLAALMFIVITADTCPPAPQIALEEGSKQKHDARK